MPGSNGVLNSWKEVAQYLARGVRTVQRWERDLGLPVRRPRGTKRSAVIAIASEIDEWVSSCPAFLVNHANGVSTHAGNIVLSGKLDGAAHINEAILRSRFLRSSVRRTRQELAATIHRLLSNLKTATATREAAAPPFSLFPPVDRAQDNRRETRPTERLVS
jgi:predicted DNA-binding transcriptional regulator AlpA